MHSDTRDFVCKNQTQSQLGEMIMITKSQKANTANKQVTHQEIAIALARFHVSGGLIEKLPTQNVVLQMMVGEEKHNIYEPISAFAALG